MSEVDGQVLPADGRSGPVVCVELNVWRRLKRPEGVTQRLDHALTAVGELVETRQVKVDTGGRTAENTLEESAPTPGRARGHLGRPVEVDV